MFGKAENVTIKVEGMHCMHCAAKVEKVLKELAGVKRAAVSLENKSVEVTYKAGKCEVRAMVYAINAAGFNASV